MFFFKKKPLLGLDIGSSTIKVAALRESGSGYELQSFGLAPSPHGAISGETIENPEALVETIENLLKIEKIPKSLRHTVFTIPSGAVTIRKITVPLMSEADLVESIEQEAEQYIPYDIDEVNVDFQIVKAEGEVPKPGSKIAPSDDRQMDVLLVAARKDTIAEYSEVVRAAGLEPVIVDLDVFALENGFQLIYGLDLTETVALINIGSMTMNINVLSGGQTAYTRDAQIGGAVMTDLIQKELGITELAAERVKMGQFSADQSIEEVAPAIVRGLEDLTDEMNKTFDLYSKTSSSRIERIYISGGVAQMEGVDRLISANTGIVCETINPFQNMKINKRQFDEAYLSYIGPSAVISVGLAMRRLDDKESA